MVGLILDKSVILISGIVVLVALLAFLWATGIAYMKDVHSDYKGEDLFGEDTSNEISNEIHPEEIWNDEKKENLKKFISEHKKNNEND
jgi:hypothetical protein